MATDTIHLADADLRHLSALRAVAEEGTFGRAAARLGFTQSAVSQQIATLERLVGEPLFDRPGGPRPVTLTPAGRLLLPHAVALLERVRAAEADLVGLRSGHTGLLRVGTFQSVSVRVLPSVLADLHRDRPQVKVLPFESDDQATLLAMLKGGELDLSFLVEPIDDDTLEVRRLCADPFVALLPLDSPILPATGPVSTLALLTQTLISQMPSMCQTLIEDGLARHGRLDISFRSNDNAAVQAMVRAGVGHAVLPSLAVDHDDPSLAIRPLDPPLDPRVLVLAHVRGRRLPPAVDAFVELATQRAAAHGHPL
jgi:DNA-binding transcriptional LysR family regulator